MDELQRGNSSNTPPAHAAPLLYEDDVVRAVMAHLESEAWTIESFALSHQHGDDIVATRGGERLIVEAKGEGSSKSTTARYGKAFNRSQVNTHVSVAVIRAMRVVSESTASAGVALPDSEPHRTGVDRLTGALRTLGVEIFWVASDHSVRRMQKQDVGVDPRRRALAVARRRLGENVTAAAALELFDTGPDETAELLGAVHHLLAVELQEPPRPPQFGDVAVELRV